MTRWYYEKPLQKLLQFWLLSQNEMWQTTGIKVGKKIFQNFWAFNYRKDQWVVNRGERFLRNSNIWFQSVNKISKRNRKYTLQNSFVFVQWKDERRREAERLLSPRERVCDQNFTWMLTNPEQIATWDRGDIHFGFWAPTVELLKILSNNRLVIFPVIKYLQTQNCVAYWAARQIHLSFDIIEEMF